MERKVYVRKSINRLCFVLALAFLLTLCGCRNKNGENEVIIPSVTTQPTTKPQDNAKKATGELRMPIPENAVRNNPYSVTTEEMRTMYSLIFEPLIGIDDQGKLTPMLAQSWARDELNSDTWRISLRTNVVWHDTTPFSADDCLYSLDKLEHYLDSENASMYYAWCAAGIDSITAIDESTLSVKFTSSGYSALYCLSFPIVCKATDLSNPLNGTGPYTLSENKNTSVRLSVNEKWWKEPAHIKSIRFYERLNNETALASYEAGQLNFVPTSSLSAGKYRKEGETIVTDLMTQDAELLIFNYANAVLYDMNIRKAIALCMDRSKLITNVYMNRAQTSDVPIAPDSWLYSTQYTTIEHNVEKANILLENAGYHDSNGDGIREKDGNVGQELSFTLLVSESTDNTARKNAGETIATQLRECGIEVNVVSKTYTLGNSSSDYIVALKGGEFDLALVGVNLSQRGDLTELFKTDGILNFGHGGDEKLLDLSNAINDAPDEVTMRDAAYQLQTAFSEKLPFLVLYFRLNSIVCSADIKGITNVREPNIMGSVGEWSIE